MEPYEMYIANFFMKNDLIIKLSVHQFKKVTSSDKSYILSDESRSKIYDPGWVRSFLCCSGWAGFGSANSGFGNFPLKIPNFYPSDQKIYGSKKGRSTIYRNSKVCSGRLGANL